MKIVSRLSEEEEQVLRLRDIVEAATGGAISDEGDLPLATDLRSIVTQVDITCASLLETIKDADNENLYLSARIDKLEAQLKSQEIELQAITDSLSGGVEFDDALDHATIDFMESILASGVAEPTFDGEISFATNVPIKKEDLKPMIAQAVESWLQSKIR